MILPVLVAVVFAAYLSFNHKDTLQSPFNSSLIEKKAMENLKMQLSVNFPNQSRQFQLNVISSYKHSILESSDPSIVILVSDKKSGDNLNCVAERLLATLDNSTDFEDAIIRPRDLTTDVNDAESVKLVLDKKLEEIYTKKRVGLVENIESIPPQSMILFYTYGDDVSTSKIPGIILMFTLKLDIDFLPTHYLLFSNNVAKLSQLLEDYLKNLWLSHIDSDQLLPLLSRITNNLILVNDEKYCN